MPQKKASLCRRPTIRRTQLDIQLLGEKVKQVASHRFLGVKFDDRLDWKTHVDEMVNSATPRINAIKRLAAKSIWQNPQWIHRIHNSVVNSMWQFGVIAYCTANLSIWKKITTCHSRSIKAYCGVPNFVSYERVCNALGIKDIKTDLLTFGKKRLCAIAAFSPFGPKIIENRKLNAAGIYKSPTEVLLDDNEAQILLGT